MKTFDLEKNYPEKCSGMWDLWSICVVTKMTECCISPSVDKWNIYQL